MTPAHQPPLVALTTSMDGNIDPATKIDHSRSDDDDPPTVLGVKNAPQLPRIVLALKP
jgi:hypothetical protein